MFFTAPIHPKIYELHVGTTYDFFKLKGMNPNNIFYNAVKGIYNLCEAIEKGALKPDVHLKATIYYFSPSTTKKFGFKSRKLNVFEMFMFSLNYIELCILYSISYKKIALIPLKNLQIASTTAGEFVKQKGKIKAVLDKIEQRKQKHNTPTEQITQNGELNRVA